MKDNGQPFYDAWKDWQDADRNEREEGAEDDFYEDKTPPYYTAEKILEVLMNFV